jgi:hypothetical protein
MNVPLWLTQFAAEAEKPNTYFNWGGDTSILGVVATIFGWMAAATGGIIVIMIVVGAIMISSSGANESLVKQGKSIIIWAIIAAICFASMWGILTLITAGT